MHEDETGNEQSYPNYSALKPLTDMERKKITLKQQNQPENNQENERNQSTLYSNPTQKLENSI